VLAVSRDKIRLGITAPRDVPVFRKEVYLSIKDEQGGGPIERDDPDDDDGARANAREAAEAALNALKQPE
jgi:hypothetical protein